MKAGDFGAEAGPRLQDHMNHGDEMGELSDNRRRDTLRRGVVISYIAMAVQFPCSVLAQMLLSRAMGSAAYGQFGIFQSVVFLLLPFTSLGVIYGIPVFVASDARREQTSHRLMVLSLALFVGAATVVAPLLNMLPEGLHVATSAGIAERVMWIVAAVALAYRTGVESLFIGQQDFLRRAIVALIYPLMFASLAVGAVVAQIRVDAFRASVMWTASFVVCAFASWLLVRRRLGTGSAGGTALVVQLGGLGFRAVLANFSTALFFRSPYLVAERLMTPVFIGLWNCVNTLADTGRQVSGVLGRVLLPYAAQRSIRSTTVAVVQAMTLALAAGFLVVLAFPTSFTQIVFGAEFADPDYVLVASFPGIAATVVASAVIQVIAARGFPLVTSVLPAVGTAIFVPCAVATHSAGTTWFAISFSVSQIVWLALCLAVYHTWEGFGWRGWCDTSIMRRALTLGRRADPSSPNSSNG
ncbi:lipopolysaccharide biosynthesis protein [Candidatus Poribacteria bacterium]|nr:lipopolysaccharide biosynthesis protein [Candidatus Poribacteria bacterium]